MSKFSFDTELLLKGSRVKQLATDPETIPVYLTTAFHVDDLDALEARYAVKGFCYNRTRNPNRSAMMEIMSYLESGEESIICSSGLAAITTTLLSQLKQGDHLLSDKTLYGETIEFFHHLPHYGIEVTYADFTDLESVEKGIRKNTALLYTETVSNPLITVVDVEKVAKIAHKNGAILMVDNTFTTCIAIRPLELGADIVVNSLTKYINGHSDTLIGAATGKADLIQKAHALLCLTGGVSDAMSSWLCQRGARTMDMRVSKQMENAVALARALDKNPVVFRVNHPSLPSHPQYELAQRIYKNNRTTAMLSFEVKPDRKKINAFLRRLEIVHYAMTLGGIRTTISHPCTSSHYGFDKETLDKMGISYGLIRVSAGIENAEDLIKDFSQALEVFA